MKIGMIGTSHTACIKAGFDMVSDDLGDAISVEFFAVGGNYFNCFEQESDGVLRAVKGSDVDCDMARKQAMNINGKTEIDLSDFDAICVVGAQTGIDAVSRLMAQVDVGDAPSGGFDAMSLISSNTFAGIQSDLIKDSLQKWMLLEQEGQHHFLMPSPFPFEKFLDPSVGGKLGQRTKNRLENSSEFIPTILHYLEKARSAFFEKKHVRLLSQPEETVSEFKVLSKNAFCRGAPRLGGEAQPAEDFTHGNADYGAIFWVNFAKAIGRPLAYSESSM